MFIGGQSRSGKSTVASAVSEALQRRAEPRISCPLDRWLRSESDRGLDVLQRHDMAALAEVVAQATARIKSVSSHCQAIARKTGSKCRKSSNSILLSVTS
ncbi:hypothetical protein ACTMU2_39175 [Cupriavidus basilensis]